MLAIFDAVDHRTRDTACVYLAVAGDIDVVIEQAGHDGQRKVQLVRTGNGAGYVYVGATANFAQRDTQKLPNLPPGVTWHRRMPARGQRRHSGHRVPVVTHAMGYAPPRTKLPLDELFRISCVEAFLIACMRAVFGYDPNHRGRGCAVVRNKSPFGLYKCALPPPSSW